VPNSHTGVGMMFSGCKLLLSLSKRLPWTAEQLDVRSRRNVTCSSGSDLYFWEATVPRWEAGVPQEVAMWGTSGCGSCCGRNRTLRSALVMDFDTEKPCSPKKSKSCEGSSLTQNLQPGYSLILSRRGAVKSQV